VDFAGTTGTPNQTMDHIRRVKHQLAALRNRVGSARPISPIRWPASPCRPPIGDSAPTKQAGEVTADITAKAKAQFTALIAAGYRRAESVGGQGRADFGIGDNHNGVLIWRDRRCE
jgi:hypothetical protein